MRSSRASGLLLLALACVLASASPAQAWTRTVVKGARATVEIERDATLSILLQLDVEVHAGWLHELELVGLGEGVELDRYRPPYLRSEEGELFRPEAVLHDDGRIHLSFPRREAPRRGEYRVFMRYRTKAEVRAVEVEDETRARVVWSVPAWETGLHDLSVQFRAPRGSSIPRELRDTPPGVEFDIVEKANRTVVEWRRTHLPRMTAWPLTVDVPMESIAVPPTTAHAPKPSGFRPLHTPGERPLAWALLLIAALVLLKRRSVETRMGHAGLLIRAPWSSVLIVTATVLAIGQWLMPQYLVCALPLVAFSLHRPSKWAAPTERKDWHRAAFKDLLEPENSARDFLDGTTWTGVGVLIVGGAALIALGEPTAALLLLPVFLTGTRHHMSATAPEKTEALRAFAAELRLPDDAPEMSFSWEQAGDGTSRLRTHLVTQRAGLMTLGFVVTASPVGLVLRRKVMLQIETRAQSDADDLMRRRTDIEPEFGASNGSILRLVDWNTEVVELLRVLARKTPKPVKASRGSWLLREISQPGRRAA